MKKLIDYQEEIHKCSKCGLCQSVCPVYEVTGNDCSVSRGKFIMLGGILKGHLKLNKNVNKYLDMCLKCNACKDFCPSGIDAREIFMAAKCEYFGGSDNEANSKFVKILNSPKVFNLFLNMIKISTNTYRFFRIDRMLKNFYGVFNRFELGKKIILANEFVTTEANNICNAELVFSIVPACDYRKYPATSADDKGSLKMVYFKGCVNEYINPSVKKAVEKILSSLGIEILQAKFQCCGVPFLSGGNIEQFKKQAEFNLAQIPDDFDCFLTDCASCQNAFEEYKKVIEDEKLLKKLDKILEKSINVNEFIAKNVKSIEFKKKIKVTFHKPCHLENVGFIKELLSKSKNIEYIEMKDYDKCCAFSGVFAITNPEISTKISSDKAKNALATGAEYILTSCPSCILGINQGLIEHKKTISVINFIELIAQADIIL